jgi:hypothetical protein
MDWDEILEEAQKRAREDSLPAAEINPMTKLMVDEMQPHLRQIIVQLFASLFKAGAEKEDRMDFMRQQMQKMFCQKLAELPPEAKAALEKTRVQVVRQPDRIEIVIDSGGDPDVEKVKSIFLDSMLVPLSQIITFFGCQVDVSPQTGD